MNCMKKCVAEFIGTAMLVIFGCGVAVWSGCDLVGTSLAFGLTIVAMAYSIGNVSGCHVNPAVSLGVFLSGRMTAKEFGAYVLAQCLGAFAGAGILGLFFASYEHLGGNEVQKLLVTNYQSPEIVGLIAEIVLTFAFVICILGVTDDKYGNGSKAGIVIGLALTLVHLLGLGLTGTSVNPARSLAPAVLQAMTGNSASLSQLWIWILGPFAGAALAAFVYSYITKESEAK